MPLDNLDNFTAAQYHPLAPDGRSRIVEDDMVRHQLRTLRQDRDLTQADIAERLDWSTSKVVRVENGQIGLKVTDAMALLGLFGVDESVADPIIETVRANRIERKPTPYAPILSPAHLRYLGYEAVATGVGTYAPIVVPDILQTSTYAQVLDAVLHPDRNSSENELAARLRRERAAYLLGKHGPPLQFVIGEATLNRPEGGPDPSGKRDQYAQLRTIITGLKTLNTASRQRLADSELNPSISIKIQPYSSGSYLPFSHDLSVLHTDSQPHAIVYAHDPSGRYTALNPSPEEPARLQLAFKELSDTLPGPEITNDMLDAMLALLPD